MGIEERYRDVLERSRAHTKQLIQSIKPGLLQDAEIGATFEFVKTNVMHILNVRSTTELEALSTQIMEEYLISKNVDHGSEFINELASATRVDDSADVIQQAADGNPYLFVGFHTGPYWTPMWLLVKSGAHLAVIVPPALQSKKDEFARHYEDCKVR